SLRGIDCLRGIAADYTIDNQASAFLECANSGVSRGAEISRPLKTVTGRLKAKLDGLNDWTDIAHAVEFAANESLYAHASPHKTMPNPMFIGFPSCIDRWLRNSEIPAWV